jgi:hypothetical protein
MKELGTTSLTSNLPSDPRWELARRVADSANFRNCPKLRAFLLYVCENALLGRPENVREQLIGATVFGRTPDYSLSEDNIVRVEARELRKRLEAYFSTEGRDEPAVIEIPKGGYTPVFKSRQAVASAAEPPQPAALVRRGPAWLVPALMAVILLLTAVVLWLGTETWRSRGASARPAMPAGDEVVYSDLLGSFGRAANRETLLVLSNPTVVLYYGSDSDQPIVEGRGHTIRAPKQLKENFGDALNNIDRDLPFQFLHFTREDYTGMGEATSAFHIGRLMQAMRRPVRLTQGRFLNWDEMQKHDLIVLGAPQINDWTNQNVGNSNFNPGLRQIDNLRPLPGEQRTYEEQYEPAGIRGSAQTDYGVIRMATSPYGFRMLLIAGLSSAGTAGVGEFFASPRKMQAIFEGICKSAPGKPFPSDWEVLVKINVRDGLPLDTSAVAVRPAPAVR